MTNEYTAELSQSVSQTEGNVERVVSITEILMQHCAVTKIHAKFNNTDSKIYVYFVLTILLTTRDSYTHTQYISSTVQCWSALQHSATLSFHSHSQPSPVPKHTQQQQHLETTA